MRRILRIIRPNEGWISLLLLLTAAGSLAFSVIEGRWVEGDRTFFVVALMAAILGSLIAKMPFPSWLSLSLGLILGAEYCYAVIAKVAPSWASLLEEFEHLWEWLAGARVGYIDANIPFANLLWASWARALGFAHRIQWWYQAGMAGKMSRDEAIFWLVAALIIWLVSFYAGWRLFRSRSPLLALTPMGLVLTTNSFLLVQDLSSVIVFIASVLLLKIQMNFVTLQERWEREHIDYSSEIRTEVVFIAGLIGAMLLLLAFFTPVLMSSRLQRAFWDRFGGRWDRIETGISRVLVDMNRSTPPGMGSQSRRGGALSPGEHELGGSVDLSEELVMRVTTDEVAIYPEWERLDAGPKRYWREMTYDRYTGTGWQNSELSLKRYEANQSLPPPPKKGTQIWQFFEIVKPAGLLYAINQPAALDQAVTAQFRANEDLAAISLPSNTYSIISWVPEVSVRDLQTASEEYPSWIERYLEVPLTVPERVEELSRGVTQGMETPYDKAKAIESYLRTFPYTTTITKAPLERDVVDYFLFELEKGYCDYFSTAMTIMARSMGVPARVAMGYATGSLEPEAGEFVVLEKDAHSWVEVYFPEYGWIEFEPTPYRSTFERPLSFPSRQEPPEPPRPRIRGFEWSVDVRSLRNLAISLGGAGLLLLYWKVRGRRIGGLPPREFVQTVYGRMYGYAEGLGVEPEIGQTPGEYAQYLGQRLEERAKRAPIFGRWPRWQQGHLRTDVTHLCAVYTKSIYSPHPVSETEREEISDAWKRLRGKLLFMSLRRRKR